MQPPALHLIEASPLPCLLSLPGNREAAPEPRPVLCFLHGYDEGPPRALRDGLTRHGPLRPASSALATAEFLVVAPQLPRRGDLWHLQAGAVQELVGEVRKLYHGDPERTYLTGFSYGANGVFDLALGQPGFWAALWPVDPTRIPAADPGRPVWLSSGEISRRAAGGFIRRLRLKTLEEAPGDRVYLDQGRDHVGTAALAYSDDRIYHWLLARRLPGQ